MIKRHKNCYIIVRNESWLMSDGSWTCYGPEVAGYTTSYKIANQLAKQVGGVVKFMSYTEVMALALEPFDFQREINDTISISQ